MTLSEPERTFRAGCGVVDTFDFPIDPPHAYAVNRGGSDFGVFRGRYDKFHAGEDWGGFSGSALGTPVHSIGHGFVTYAQPLGWGRDKGVIIVQHVMQDGSEILSFYGHMDEESFQVSAGECVTRGQHLADIGNPRTPPHLHFEMRTQAPYQTLSGYWPEDPRTQGWVWPSQTIWAERLRVGPGVSWARDFTDIGTRPLAQISAEQYLIFEDENLLILSLADGESRPLRIDLGEDVKIIAAGASQDTLFIADSAGVVTAFDTTQLESNILATKWQIERTLSQPVALIPRENGQLIIANRVSITSYAPGGRELWRHNLSQERLYDWQEAEGDFYFTLTGGAGSFWRATEENIVEKIGDAGGKLAYTANQNKPSSLWVYNPDGVYQFQLAPDSPFWLARPLSGGILNRGDILPLPDGGVLIAHADREDRRLIWLDDLGFVTDQWSYDGVLQGDQRLLSEGWQLYLISYGGPESLRDIPVYKINLQQRSLQHILTAGSRTPLQADHWTVQLDDGRILINVGGGPMGLFDPVEALEIVKP